MLVKNTKQLHEIVCKDGICSVCKLELQLNMLCPHHFPHTKGARPDLRFETTNCISVCQECHNKLHNGEIKL